VALKGLEGRVLAKAFFIIYFFSFQEGLLAKHDSGFNVESDTNIICQRAEGGGGVDRPVAGVSVGHALGVGNLSNVYSVCPETIYTLMREVWP